MKRYVYDRFGGPEVLRLEETASPDPEGCEVVIRNRAVSVNPVDWKLMRGDVPVRGTPGHPSTPGCDFAGEVVRVGPRIAEYQPGDRVFGMRGAWRSGTFAQEICVPLREIVPLPDELDFVHGAAVPLAALTAWRALFTAGELRGGQRILVNGASGGVGTFAVQLAVAEGIEVVAVSSGRNRDLCLELGASSHIDYHTADLADPPVDKYDLVLDAVGTLGYRSARRLVKRKGTVVSLLPYPGNLFRRIMPRISGPRFRVIMVRPRRDHLLAVCAHIRSGRVRPVIDHVYPFDRLPEAVERSMSNRAVGKVVVTLDAR